MPTCPIHFNPLASPHLENPHPAYAQAREETPIFFSPIHGAWMITRYADVLGILRDPERFSSRHLFRQPVEPTPEAMAELAQVPPEVRLLVTEDPPSHGRTRALVSKAFSPQRVARMEARTYAIAHELIDAFVNDGQADDGQADDGQVDLMDGYTYPLPVRVLLEFVGLAATDADFLRQWCVEHMLLAVPGISAEQQLKSARAEVAFSRYADALIAKRRQHPHEDLLSALIHTRVEGERPLDDVELNTLLQQLLFAGHETTTNLLNSTLHTLLGNRALWQAICTDPALIPNAVEEGLRHDAAVPGMFRTATQDVEISGVSIPANAKLFLSFAAANRDEHVFTDADVFDLHRPNADKHFSLGQGIHYCVGAKLARMEARIAIEVLAERLPDMRLVDTEPSYLPSLINRAMLHLPATWGESSAQPCCLIGEACQPTKRVHPLR